MMAKSVQVGIRMESEKREALKEAADAESRTVSSLIDYEMTRFLREKGLWPRPARKVQRSAAKPQPTRAHR